ncbi:MAG TPA: nuclear transport factor 2 family protein [Actinomycetota bacterium]|nr:nuclear transport factor 2 family protein [Actinomycetota bacterium]
MKERTGRDIVERYMQAIPGDFDTLGELHHPDFVQEFPQSGEVIRGHENFRAAHERYATVRSETRRVTGSEDRWILSPGFPSFTPTRIVGYGDTFTVEALGTYPGGETYLVVAILQLRDEKVFRARTYFAAPFEAPGWRAPWVEPMAGTTPASSQS